MRSRIGLWIWGIDFILVAQSEQGKALLGLNHDIKQSQANYWHLWEIGITHYYQSHLVLMIHAPTTRELNGASMSEWKMRNLLRLQRPPTGAMSRHRQRHVACAQDRGLDLRNISKWTRTLFGKRKLRNFQHRSFCKGKTRAEQWWATSRSYGVSWNFIRRSATLNLVAGWGVPEPHCSM